MKLDKLGVMLWLWTVTAVAVGITLIVLDFGSLLGTVGVVLIVIGLVSIMPAMQSTIGDLSLDSDK
jgi:predicted cobalt transporter CbtA